MLLSDERLRAGAKRGGEVGPRHERREREEAIAHTVGRHARQAAEEHVEHHHRHRRLDEGPRGAKDRLPVAHLGVAPHEKVQKLAVRPELRQIERATFADGSDERYRRGVRGCRQHDQGASARNRPSIASPHARDQCASPRSNALHAAAGADR